MPYCLAKLPHSFSAGGSLCSDSSLHFICWIEARTESDQSVCVYVKILHTHCYREGQAARQVGGRQKREPSSKFRGHLNMHERPPALLSLVFLSGIQIRNKEIFASSSIHSLGPTFYIFLVQELPTPSLAP